MEQVGNISNVSLVGSDNALILEASSLFDELLASKPKLTVPELFQLFDFAVAPTVKIIKVLLARKLNEHQFSKLIIFSIQKDCLDEIWSDLPEIWFKASIRDVIERLLSAEWIDQERRLEVAVRFGTMLVERKDAGDEDFVFVISHIPSLRIIAWERLISLEGRRVDFEIHLNHIISMLAYYDGEELLQKAAWILTEYPSIAGRLLRSDDLNVVVLAAEHILAQADFDDKEIYRLIAWKKLGGTDIPTRAIARVFAEIEKADESLSGAIYSSFATEAQKEQAAGVLLRKGEEIPKDILQAIVSFVPAYAPEAAARLERMVAAIEAKVTPREKLMRRLYQLDTEYRSSVP